MKNFDPILEDYAFFENHATEAANDLAAHEAFFEKIRPTNGTVFMVDYGAGAGKFTEQFLKKANWKKERLHLSLIEPGEDARHLAVNKLGHFSSYPIRHWPSLPNEINQNFDLILANHVLYYVADLEVLLAKILTYLDSSGVFLISIAGSDNTLIQFWQKAFMLINQPVPYYIADDFERILEKLNSNFLKKKVRYTLRFPDLVENRLKILRFLFADHLAQMPLDQLLAFFNPFCKEEFIKIETCSDHFVIQS